MSPDIASRRLDADEADVGAGSARPLRVALACPGVGLVQRGFERLFADLFKVLAPHCDATLFKGGGDRREREIVLPFLARGGSFLRRVPLHRLIGRTPMHVECLTFALALLPHLRNGAFDVVHTIDPPLTRLLHRMREALGLRFALVYTEGCAMPPGDYPPADHYHQISKVTLEDAARHGHDPARMSLIPCGIDLDRFATSNSREDVRHRFGIRPETFVVLSVAALNRNHKRTHHLIEEVSRLDGDVLLWLDGSLDHGEPELVDVATQRLGDRCLVTHVPSDQVGDLFRAADVMAHAALFEAFGLSIVEAAASGVPLLIHDAPHFQWLVPNSECHIDMSEEGMLAERLGGLMANRSSLEGLTDTANARSTYAWPVLAGNYLNLYRSVAEARAQS